VGVVLVHEPDDKACEHLSASDPRMASLIAQVGALRLELTQDPFVSLARAIVGQQLSVKAAATIWGRFLALGPMVPEAILEFETDALRAVGLSQAKAAYMQDLARHARTGELELTRLEALDDEGVIQDVTRVKGIGRWTAEMFLIFSLGRPDVLAVDDLGLRRAAGWLVGENDPLGAVELAELGTAWAPYRSVASLYLWEALDRGIAS